MDLVRLVFVGFLLALASGVGASVSTTLLYYGGGHSQCESSDPLAVMRCENALGSSVPESSFSGCTVTSEDSQLAYGYCIYTPNGAQFTYNPHKIYGCPANSVSSGPSCTCATGFDEVSGACVPHNDCPPSGTQIQGAGYQAKAGTGTGNTICAGGCLAKGAFSARYGGINYVTGPIIATGEACSTTGEGGITPAEPVPTPCGAGKCPGSVTINGTTTTACYACDSVTTTKTTTSSASAASAASGAAPSASSVSSGSSSSTTTCTGNACTTTKTITKNNADGSSSSSKETETKDKASYCADNPKDVACKGDDDSKWDGTCTAGFSCDGDAVQCAQAQASWKSYCAMKVDESDTSVTLGRSAVSAGVGGFAQGTDPNAGGDNRVDVATSFDQTNPYGSACPADKVIPVMGQSITIPISRLCPYLQIMGYMAVSFTLLAATKVALGGA